jgi:hypothetical protein
MQLPRENRLCDLGKPVGGHVRMKHLAMPKAVTIVAQSGPDETLTLNGDMQGAYC